MDMNGQLALMIESVGTDVLIVAIDWCYQAITILHTRDLIYFWNGIIPKTLSLRLPFCRGVVKKLGGCVLLASTNGLQRFQAEIKGTAAPNVPNKDAKRRIRKKDKCHRMHRFLHRLGSRIQIIISIQVKRQSPCGSAVLLYVDRT